jgi:hypothetical protein
MSGILLIAAIAAQPAASGTTAPPPASTETTGKAVQPGESTYVDLEGGIGYSTNPILSQGTHNGAGFGRISAHAVHTRVTARTTTVLSGYAQSLFYTKRLGAQESFDVNGRHDAAVSEKLRVFFDGDVAYDKGGQLDTRIIGVPNVPLLPGSIVPPPLLAPGGDFLTVTGRTYRADANVGAQWALSARESLNLSTGIDHIVLKSGGVETRYTTIPASIGYDRQINERTNIGARVVGQFTHYSTSGFSTLRNVQVITPELTAQLTLSPTLTLSGDAGVSFSAIDDGVRTRHSTGASGDVNLCSSSERSQFCARASLQQQAATSAGPARVASLGVDYSRKVSADDTIQFSLAAERYSNPIIIVSGQSFTHAAYIRAAADYSRHIGHRLYGGAELAVRKLTETGPDPDADISGSLFIRYRFGDVQ